MAQATMEVREAKAAMLDWQFKLALALHEPYPSARELLLNALHVLMNVYLPGGAFAATIDRDGGLHDICVLGEINEAELRRGLLEPALRGTRTVTSADGYSAAVVLKAHEQICGVIALRSLKRTPFNSDSLYDLEAAAQLIGAATATMLKREMAYEERNRQAQLQHDLTAMTYHDLRAPLQNVQTSFAALDRLLAASTDSRVEELVQTGARSARQIGRMIRSLLDMERLENGTIQLHPQPTPLPEVMNEVTEIVMPLAMEADHQLTVDIDPAMPMLQVDGNLMERVLVNLIENAIKYTPAGGCIRVTGSATGGAAYISVIDDGPGIPNHLREAIFDKYYRIHSTSGRDGIGLGLPFCRLAIEAHGGRIWVEGDDPGTRFTFMLPVDAEQKASTR